MRRLIVLSCVIAGAAAAFAGYAGKIVFTSNRDGNAEVYLMNADGSAETRLTNNKAGDDQPALSPDGTKVVFVSNRDGNSELYLVGADGKGVKRLTDTDYPALDPSFSPDGKSVVFTSMAEGGKDIRRLDLASGKMAEVITDEGDQFMAREAPDGALVYVNDDGDEDVVIRAPDGKTRNLSQSPGVDTMPAFSPDGQVVYFVSQRGGDYDVYAVNRDGSGLREVIGLESLEDRAALSPDGAFLAVGSDMDGDLEVYIFSATGEKLAQLTNNDYDDYEPYWGK